MTYFPTLIICILLGVLPGEKKQCSNWDGSYKIIPDEVTNINCCAAQKASQNIWCSAIAWFLLWEFKKSQNALQSGKSVFLKIDSLHLRVFPREAGSVFISPVHAS